MLPYTTLLAAYERPRLDGVALPLAAHFAVEHPVDVVRIGGGRGGRRSGRRACRCRLRRRGTLCRFTGTALARRGSVPALGPLSALEHAPLAHHDALLTLAQAHLAAVLGLEFRLLTLPPSAFSGGRFPLTLSLLLELCELALTLLTLAFLHRKSAAALAVGQGKLQRTLALLLGNGLDDARQHRVVDVPVQCALVRVFGLRKLLGERLPLGARDADGLKLDPLGLLVRGRRELRVRVKHVLGPDDFAGAEAGGAPARGGAALGRRRLLGRGAPLLFRAGRNALDPEPVVVKQPVGIVLPVPTGGVNALAVSTEMPHAQRTQLRASSSDSMLRRRRSGRSSCHSHRSCSVRT